MYRTREAGSRDVESTRLILGPSEKPNKFFKPWNHPLRDAEGWILIGLSVDIKILIESSDSLLFEVNSKRMLASTRDHPEDWGRDRRMIHKSSRSPSVSIVWNGTATRPVVDQEITQYQYEKPSEEELTRVWYVDWLWTRVYLCVIHGSTHFACYRDDWPWSIV